MEGLWADNRFTAKGAVAHERVPGGGGRSEPGVRTAFALHLRSLRLGLSGVADVVEFHNPATKGPWRPFPVEHKRGRPKRGDRNRVQLAPRARAWIETRPATTPYLPRRRAESRSALHLLHGAEGFLKLKCAF
ncbi:hypothetical protein JCM15519_06760 [Fundidesulfovibrio butyratiphilus]